MSLGVGRVEGRARHRAGQMAQQGCRTEWRAGQGVEQVEAMVQGQKRVQGASQGIAWHGRAGRGNIG